MTKADLVCKYYTTEQACRNYCKAQNDCIEPLDNGKYCCQIKIVTRAHERAFQHFGIAFMAATALVSALWIVCQAYIQLSRRRQVTHFDCREFEDLVVSEQAVQEMRELLYEKATRAKQQI